MGEVSWPAVLTTLIERRDLDVETASGAMRAIMSGEASPAHIAAFLVALRAKGETVDEIVGLARVMREFSVKVNVPDLVVVDTCGTGGDRAGTVNISTMASFVVAGAGVRVAKHGNRASSSVCGSADVLEALGVAIELSPESVAACIVHAGIGFMFAPAFHPSMRFAGPVRRELGVPSVFNFLGPLTNPAGARRQTIGVSDPGMAPKMADALARLGAQRAMVFRGEDGLDELSTTGRARVWEVREHTVEESMFDPSELGLAAAASDDLRGGDAQHNAEVCRRLLDGEQGPVRDTVLVNAAAALVVAGEAPSMADGLQRGATSIDSGAAREVLERFVTVSRAERGD
jgi:anthranilate phosphoribosyltransferase